MELSRRFVVQWTGYLRKFWAENPASGSRRGLRSAGGQREGSLVKVLLVEDEELTREGIKACIPWESIGISGLYTAEDGEEGLETAKAVRPDIIMADVRMPRMDGITMAFEIRKALKSCRFIFISGYCDKEYLKSAIELSAVNYIEKPVEPGELLDALKKSVLQVEEDRRRRALEEEYRSRFRGVLEDLPEEDLIPASWQSSMQIADRIERYIQENFADLNLSLTQLADHLALSKQYMCWVFKKEKNETINQCIIRTRLRRAKEFMRRNPHVKVKTVAEKSGFADCSYFIKIYKKYERMTPADFLRLYNGQGTDA